MAREVQLTVSLFNAVPRGFVHMMRVVAQQLPSFVLEVAIDAIVQEIGVYLGIRSDVLPQDIREGFEDLAGSVVATCHAAITRAETQLSLHGDVDAFDRELRTYARRASKVWADSRARDVKALDRIELDASINATLRALELTTEPSEMTELGTRLFAATCEIARRADLPASTTGDLPRAA